MDKEYFVGPQYPTIHNRDLMCSLLVGRGQFVLTGEPLLKTRMLMARFA